MTREQLKLGGIFIVVTVLALLCGDLASHAWALSVAVPPAPVTRKASMANFVPPPSVEKAVADTRALFAPPPEAISALPANGPSDVATTGPWDEWLADPQHNLTLVGTMISSGSAIAVVVAGGEQYALELWQPLGTWRVLSITDTQVQFQRNGTVTVLELPMLAPSATPTSPLAMNRPPARAGGFGSRLHMRRGSDGVTILQRSDVTAAINDPGGITRGMRMDPMVKNGLPYGIVMNYLEPSNMFSSLGLRQGDVMLSINGQDLRNQDDGIKAYLMLQNENSLDIKIERGGVPQDLHVEIQ